jgi:short-subunit dehydrogenase
MRVFITGASSGIGEGLARHYARAGATIGMVARRTEVLDALARELESSGARARVYGGDVADTAFMQRCATQFVDAAGGVDLVVANAGIGIKNTVRSGDAESVAQLMRINVIGVTNAILPFVPKMIEQRSGVLCAVSSFAGHRALPGRSAYCASKAAVITFMDGLRMDLHGTGVHAMTICPGFVKTPLTEGNRGMRFVVELDDAVRAMTGAIAARADTFTFPWQMRWLTHVVKRAPEAMLRKGAPPARTR